jgi:hypothetical protein
MQADRFARLPLCRNVRRFVLRVPAALLNALLILVPRLPAVRLHLAVPRADSAFAGAFAVLL